MNISIEKKLEDINNILRQETPGIKNSGLLNGKMGVSLYFFHLASETETPERQEFAEQLIDEVYEEVSKNQLPPDFENGLAGIAWGIEHLVQHGFVEAETDLILRDVDDKIYRFITTNHVIPAGVQQGVIGYMMYILSRLNGMDPDSKNTSTIIFKRLLTELINRLGTAIEENKLRIREPRLFDITWDLPISLILLGQCYGRNIHTTKIERILEHLTYEVLALYPRYMCHRLYLLYGIESVFKYIDLPGWKQHAGLLKQGIQIDNIQYDELKDKSIHFRNGITGIAFIINQYVELTEDRSFLLRKENLIHKLISSEFWEWMIHVQPVKKINPGLLAGLAGVAMHLLELLKDQPEKMTVL